MFGIGGPEFLVIVIVAVIVIGPKDLPRVLYTLGKFLRKFRTFSNDIRRSLDDILSEGELQEITREANKAGGENLQANIEAQIQLENKKNGTTG